MVVGRPISRCGDGARIALIEQVRLRPPWTVDIILVVGFLLAPQQQAIHDPRHVAAAGGSGCYSTAKERWEADPAAADQCRFKRRSGVPPRWCQNLCDRIACQHGGPGGATGRVGRVASCNAPPAPRCHSVPPRDLLGSDLSSMIDRLRKGVRLLLSNRPVWMRRAAVVASWHASQLPGTAQGHEPGVVQRGGR